MDLRQLVEGEAAFTDTLSVQHTCNPGTYCFLPKGERCREKQHVSEPGSLPSQPAFKKITGPVTLGMDPGVVLALSVNLAV